MRFNIYKLYWIWIITLLLVTAQGCDGGNIDMTIELKIVKPEKPQRTAEEIPIFNMAENLTMAAVFENETIYDMELEDPQTSQNLFLKMVDSEALEDMLFFMNPPEMDATGEITAPIVKTVTLKPDGNTTLKFELLDKIPDQCFLPGFYQLYIEYKDFKSPVLEFGIEYRPESVARLVELAADENTERWLRSESMKWLKKLPKPPEILLPPIDETDEDKIKRTATNDDNVKIFLHQWRYDKDSKEIETLFEQYRITK